MSALATIVGSLGELTESEIRQLYLMVGVRLGIPDAPPGLKPGKQGGGKATNAKKPSSGKSGKKATSSKGNPKRKSQWANHPQYREYARLKKVVELQAKELKCSFNAVDTAESRAYSVAFSQWLEAKSSFRGHGEGGQDRVPPGEKKEEADGEESSSEEEDEGEGEPPESSTGRAKPDQPKDMPVVPSETRNSPPRATAGKSSSGSPGKGKSAAS